MRKYFIIPLLLVIVFFGFLVIQGMKYVPKIPSDQQEEMISPTKKIPDNWKKYENKQLGFSLYLPPDFSISENGDASILFNPPKGTSPVGQTRFMYISIVTDMANTDGKVYNFNAPTNKKLEAIPEGVSKSVSDLPEQGSWFTYKRLSDTELASKRAKAFVNTNPWEFPIGTTEYRYHIDLPNKLVLVGGYVDSTSSAATFDQSTLTSILDTFQFL